MALLVGLVKGVASHSEDEGEEQEHDDVDNCHFPPIVLDLREDTSFARIAAEAQLSLVVIVDIAIGVGILGDRASPIRCIQEQEVANRGRFAASRLLVKPITTFRIEAQQMWCAYTKERENKPTSFLTCMCICIFACKHVNECMHACVVRAYEPCTHCL
jgi:hypothetical protein